MKGLAAIIISYSVCTVRGFQPWEANRFVQAILANDSINPKQVLVGRLHNDDIHSFEEVIKAMQSMNIPKPVAIALTTAVDGAGDAVICTTIEKSLKELRDCETIAAREGLLFSICSSEVVAMEPRICSILEFLLSVGSTADSMRRLIAKSLLTECQSLLPASIDPYSSVCEAPISIVSPASICASSEKNLFPFTVQHLVSPPLATMDLSQPTFEQSSAADIGADFTSHAQHPFDSCECNCLGIMILASPFFAKSIKKLLNDLVIKYQHDVIFKYGFSQLLTVLYPSIYGLYFRNRGTEDKSILLTSVQLYTANSIVALMSTDGMHSRLLVESKPVKIAKMLTSTMLMILRDIGCRANQSVEDGSAFIAHHSIKTNRLTHLCHDIDYVTGDNVFASRLLCDDVDAGMVRTIYTNHDDFIVFRFID